jgi:hypothetical protein
MRRFKDGTVAFFFREHPVAADFPAGIEHSDLKSFIEQILGSGDP